MERPIDTPASKPTPRSLEPAAGDGYEVIDHTADWALRVYGHDWRQLLINAGRGMSSLLVADPAAVPMDVARDVEMDAFDAETLLVDWLSELAYWAESEMLVFREFDLDKVTSTYLQGTVRGGRVTELQKHIKAVTYHNLEIVATDQGLAATIVFDV